LYGVLHGPNEVTGTGKNRYGEKDLGRKYLCKTDGGFSKLIDKKVK
jgi:hypothetical protein